MAEMAAAEVQGNHRCGAAPGLLGRFSAVPQVSGDLRIGPKSRDPIDVLLDQGTESKARSFEDNPVFPPPDFFDLQAIQFNAEGMAVIPSDPATEARSAAIGPARMKECPTS